MPVHRSLRGGLDGSERHGPTSHHDELGCQAVRTGDEKARRQNLCLFVFMEHVLLYVHLVLVFVSWVQVRILLGATTHSYLADVAEIMREMHNNPHWHIALAYLLHAVASFVASALGISVVLGGHLCREWEREVHMPKMPNDSDSDQY